MNNDTDDPTDEESSEQSPTTEETTMTDTDEMEPSETPPRAESAMETTSERPTQTPPANVESAAGGGEAAEPTERPPSEAESEEEAYGATTWHNDKKITALWSIDQNRNSWVHVAGLGWKKLADNSDSAVVALTALGTHARRTGTTVNLREEDGKITQIYVW
jgi:hypothetical protein